MLVIAQRRVSVK